MAREKKLTPSERRRLYRLVSKMYALLNSGDWAVRLERIDGEEDTCLRLDVPLDTEGVCDFDRQKIYADYRYNVLTTLVHECLHALYPDHSEDEIMCLEKFVMDNISRTQARRLLEMALFAHE